MTKILRATKVLMTGAAIASIVAILPQSAFAQESLAKTKSGGGRKTYHVNPDIIRRALLSGDTSVMTALNEVYIAKGDVNLARSRLLPSINVGGVLGGLAGGPSFAVSSISMLLPFLLPSNWFGLSASEHQFAATGFAYNLVELNEYASAWAMYTTILSDYQLRETYQRQYDNLKMIVEAVSAKVEVGQATQADLAQAQFNLNNAATIVSNVNETIKHENQAIIKMFGWPIDTALVFDELHPSPLKIESARPQALLDQVFVDSNEARQIRSLILASKDLTGAAAFSWLGGASINLPNTSGGVLPKSISGMTVTGSANLGFGTLVNIELSQFATKQLQIAYSEAYNTMGQVVATALNSLVEAKNQLHSASAAEMYAQKEYEAKFEAYRAGNLDLNNALQAVTDINTAVAARVKAEADIDAQRITLYRLLVTGPFLKIPGCKIKGNESGSPMGLPVIGWITDLFSTNGSQTQITVDQLCRGNAPAK